MELVEAFEFDVFEVVLDADVFVDVFEVVFVVLVPFSAATVCSVMLKLLS